MRLGLAVGPDRLVAVEARRTRRGLRPGRVQARALAPPTDEPGWPDLSEAVREFLEALSADGGTAAIALLRPLAQAKAITVPPVRRSQLRALVARNVRRYFIVGDKPLLADALPLTGAGRKGPIKALAACADERLAERVHAAVSEAGLHVESMSAAPLTLMEAVRRLEPATRRDALVVAVCSSDWMEGLAVQRGVPHLLEPWSGRAIEEVARLSARLADAGGAEAAPDAAPVERLVLADSEQRRKLAEDAIHARGDTVVASEPLRELDPTSLAAFGATVMREEVPQLLPAGPRQERRRGELRRLAAISAAAALLFGATAALQHWGERRELNAVLAERRANAGEVAEAFELKQTAEGIRQRIEAIAAVQARLPQWTPALAGLAEALPDSAYLVSLTADGIQLRLAGLATSASSVVPALQASPLFQDVALTSALQREGTEEVERFDLALALRTDSLGRLLQPKPGGAP